MLAFDVFGSEEGPCVEEVGHGLCRTKRRAIRRGLGRTHLSIQHEAAASLDLPGAWLWSRSKMRGREKGAL